MLILLIYTKTLLFKTFYNNIQQNRQNDINITDNALVRKGLYLSNRNTIAKGTQPFPFNLKNLAEVITAQSGQEEGRGVEDPGKIGGENHGVVLRQGAVIADADVAEEEKNHPEGN